MNRIDTKRNRVVSVAIVNMACNGCASKDHLFTDYHTGDIVCRGCGWVNSEYVLIHDVIEVETEKIINENTWKMMEISEEVQNIWTEFSCETDSEKLAAIVITNGTLTCQKKIKKKDVLKLKNKMDKTDRFELVRIMQVRMCISHLG